MMEAHAEGSSRRGSLIRSVMLLLALAVLLIVLLGRAGSPPDAGKGRKSGQVRPAVALSAPSQGTSLAALAPPGGGFSPQVRLGFTNGDQWEPAIAADDFGHVYVLYAQYFGVPGCDDCASPTNILQISNDGGKTWGPPTVIYPSAGDQQWDSQIAVDPADGRTVYASFMNKSKSDILVGKSTDFGQTWTFAVADGVNAGTDKPILAVRGQDVYVAYNHSNTIWLSSSHDGGQTWSHAEYQTNKRGWSLPGGGTVTPDGAVYFAWGGYQKSGNATGKTNLYVTKSSDGGQNWQFIDIATSESQPDCSAYLCGWAYLGAQLVMASDSAGTLYVLWNSNTESRAPMDVFFSKSSDGGATWTTPVDVSGAPAGVDHAFPAIDARGPGQVSISWMDARENHNGLPVWNTYYRSSTDGGASWSAEADISSYVAGFSYIFLEGFRYPFGDYYELAIDANGLVHVVMGEGFSYDSPGSIWYTQGK